MKVKNLKLVTEDHLSSDFGVTDIVGNSLFELSKNIGKIIEQAEELRRRKVLHIVK
jgi:hypothetical protein